jgi:hypothetical protein
MKKKIFKLAYIITAFVMLSLASCGDLLDEHPQSNTTPELYKTASGIFGGLAGVYSNLRNLWGTEGFHVLMVAGTDEHLSGASASSKTYYDYNGMDVNGMGSLWTNAYQNINTLNGVLELGSSVADITPANRRLYFAQARFLRGMFYFYLVQAFGDVPLNLEYQAEPSTEDLRDPIADVYAAIIADLDSAVAGLPNQPTAPFAGKAATKATALYLQSKVYLTRGWSSAAQTTDFTQSYTIAEDLITNKGTYGLSLWDDYADVNKDGNDYGKEVLFAVDYNNDAKYGEWVAQSSGGKNNLLNSMFRPNYPNMNGNYPASGGGNPMTRDIANGRPYVRTRPNTPYIYNQAFVNRDIDTRYDKTFQTVWITNTSGAVTPRGTLTKNVDTAIWMPPFEVSADKLASFKGVILTPNGDNGGNKYTNVFFPAVKKFNDPTRSHMNDPSDRPLIVFRLAEVYLIAAEARLKAGYPDEAAGHLNTIRHRAAYKSTNTTAENAAAALSMEITGADVTVDFILDERTRELYAELHRWFDLVRTHKLLERVTLWNAEASPYIDDHHVLRPIPVASEIDLLTNKTEFPQNPEY